MAVLFAEVFDVAASGLEDTKAWEAQHRDECAVAAVGRLLGGGQQGFELQVLKPRVGDSAGTCGRRTYSAGECSSTPSIRHVR